MPTAYSYVRFSSAEQAKGNSLSRQLEATREVCRVKGWTLDETLTLDQGISAWKGKNKKAGSLGKFLGMVESDAIKPGSILIVESLDRISRQSVNIALETLLSIVNRGVSVHTTIDGQTIDARNPNISMALMQSIMHLSLPNEESEKKSVRVHAAWSNKQKNAGNGKILTHKTPGWIRVAGGKYELIPSHVATVKKMVRWIRDGMGFSTVSKKLNAEKIPTFRGTPFWHQTSVKYVLNSRTLIGEYQPQSYGKDVGQPVKDFYPAVITEDQFYEVQSVLESKKRTLRGKASARVNNLFSGILKTTNGGTVTVGSTGAGKHKYLYNMAGKQGAEKKWIFRNDIFEHHFFAWMRDIKLAESSVEDAPPNMAELAKIETRIKEIEAAMIDGDASITSLNSALKGLNAKRLTLAEQVEAWKRKQAETVADPSDILALVKKSKDPETRMKIRAAVSSMVEQVNVTVFQTPDFRRWCLAEVAFKNGEVRGFSIRTQTRKREVQHESWAFDDAKDLLRQLNTLEFMEQNPE